MFWVRSLMSGSIWMTALLAKEVVVLYLLLSSYLPFLAAPDYFFNNSTLSSFSESHLARIIYTAEFSRLNFPFRNTNRDCFVFVHDLAANFSLFLNIIQCVYFHSLSIIYLRTLAFFLWLNTYKWSYLLWLEVKYPPQRFMYWRLGS